MTPILEIENVSKRFTKKLDAAGKIAARLGANIREETVHAVDNVSMSIMPGEVLGLVGESGCGKSTLGRVVAGIHPPSAGQLHLDGTPINDLSAQDKRRANLDIQMIFQDPSSSLNPRMRVEDIISEAPRMHKMVSGASETSDFVDDLMRKVGLDPVMKRRYPHQFSGGQRQRIGIARALAVKPRFLVCDEAIAALDVSIQAQVINLFADLREDLGLTYLFISHDLSVVQHITDRVAIMYLGRIVEIAPTDDIFSTPRHPYTRALLDQVPRLDQRKQDFTPIRGEIPSPLDPPTGCHFHPRCPHATDLCRQNAPQLSTVLSGHMASCHHLETLGV
ncbi:ABC transporter ATP-binding protein [Roseobacter sp. CCS2]|uniref:ABC transporter ATP-binding protein n=1 Tax=Roseobacter sp. CCS2 TaxID=391593 RepID=UPI0000F3F14A|nr:ABC transporter ATP-binding protein [Roseobacter sp. CCS2]EBA11177.1 Oligopeptide/dipeptide ABC transporter, ATP-binding protein, C-terminal [Roseobacter sp. CCS2]